MRVQRNNIGLYFGRTKNEYSAPVRFSPVAATLISHNKVLEYMELTYQVASQLDKYLKDNFIGSYDIIKYYYIQCSNGKINDKKPGERANQFMTLLGTEGLRGAGKAYCRSIVNYFDLDSPEEMCRYNMKSCILEINRTLKDMHIVLESNGQVVNFRKSDFRRYVRKEKIKANPECAQKNVHNTEQVEYLYSKKLINSIVQQIEKDPAQFMCELRQDDSEQAEPDEGNMETEQASAGPAPAHTCFFHWIDQSGHAGHSETPHSCVPASFSAHRFPPAVLKSYVPVQQSLRQNM